MISLRASLATLAVLLSLSALPAGAAELCSAPAAAPGAVLRGPVLEVLDGDTLCIALGPSPEQWLRLRLSDADAARATAGVAANRGALMAVAFGQDVDCRIVAVTASGATAVCERDGRTLAAAAAEPQAIRAGLRWR